MAGYMENVASLGNEALSNTQDSESEDGYNPEEINEDWVRERIAEITKGSGIITSTKWEMDPDETWIDQSMTATVKLDEEDNVTRFMSSADNKWVDTRVGGNLVVNPLPQFTRYADIRSKGLLPMRESVNISKMQDNLGMGHYYSEAIDDTKHQIHMRFGVPQFNSMLSFFTSFYDSKAAQETKTGSLLYDIFYTGGSAYGTILTLTYWPLLLANFFGVAGKFLMKKPSTKYYYLRPSMNLYWATVSSMLNQIAVYKRMTPYNQGKIDDGYREDVEVDQSTVQALQSMLPGIYSDSGYIDVYAIAGRPQFIANRVNENIAKELENLNWSEKVAWVKARGTKAWFGNNGRVENSIVQGVVEKAERSLSMNQTANKIQESERKLYGSLSSNETGSKEALQASDKKILAVMRSASIVSRDGTGSEEMKAQAAQTYDGLMDIAKSVFNDGLEFASFRVDYAGSTDESFTNSTKPSEMQNKINSISADAREANFSFMEGNIDGGIITSILDAAKGLIEGVLDSVKLSGFMSLAGAAFVDIPEHWDNSSASLPKMSYSMSLTPVYGNPISQILEMHLPICMLLAATLPLSTGPQSYSSPFLLELYDKGRAQTRLGIIDSLSITRGTTNLGFNHSKAFLSADVTFTVRDLSSVMHMPAGRSAYPTINPVKLIRNATQSVNQLFAEENNYSDYLNVLASTSLDQQIYISNKLKDNWAIMKRNWGAMFSKTAWMGWLHETPVGLLDVFAKGTARE